MNFIIFHSCMWPFLESFEIALKETEATGELKWANDPARIPQEHGVTKIYAELGTAFANSPVTYPRLAAAILGTLIEGMGVDHICGEQTQSSTVRYSNAMQAFAATGAVWDKETLDQSLKNSQKLV
ncbi:MAG: hypothetical protein ACR2PG_25900 [Hyphomicrobiaceae bacterium]